MIIKELKEKYLKFFKEKGHKIISGSSLIPENDPTVLFTTAGMHPLVPYLLGEKHPAGNKLVNVQKCIRTGDIDEVGDDVHLTFFEMLGNWSLGAYWKKEAIEMSCEFLTSKKWLGLDKNKLAISCFEGEPDKGINKDEESAKIWQSLGISKERIVFLDRKENWWGPAGETGPCGPDTEMFYWSSNEPVPKKFNPKDERWIEIWNDVFMEYNKRVKGQRVKESRAKDIKYEYVPLKQRNIDTGMGVERTVAVLNGKKSVYDIEPLKSITNKIQSLCVRLNLTHKKEVRVIADHLRAATFIMGDEKGIAPSNLEQGYVVRRLIRRAIRYGKKLGIDKPFTHHVSKLVIELMSDEYPELKKNENFINEQMVQEEERFGKVIEKGIKELGKMAIGQWETRTNSGKIIETEGKEINGKNLFYIFSTFGFPLEMSFEEINNIRKEIGELSLLSDSEKFEIEKEFQEEFKKHQELSRTATAGKFKSGLADNTEEVTKLHTSTHLLLAALRKVLGEHVYQKGSNITGERLRFDFSHSEKLTDEQIKKVENIVNEQIKKDLPISCCETSLEEAKKMNAMGVFESKYGDKVKVYTVGKEKEPFSCEICAGPHVKSTGELGHFKIIKEESSSAGVRRIKAILE